MPGGPGGLGGRPVAAAGGRPHRSRSVQSAKTRAGRRARFRQHTNRITRFVRKIKGVQNFTQNALEKKIITIWQKIISENLCGCVINPASCLGEKRTSHFIRENLVPARGLVVHPPLTCNPPIGGGRCSRMVGV